MRPLIEERSFKNEVRAPRVRFFDLDGTLYDYTKAHLAAEKILLQQLSKFLEIPLSEAADHLANAREKVKARLGETASSHSRLIYLAEMLRHFQISNRAQTALNLENLFWREFLLHSALYENVIEFLTLLRLGRSSTILVTDLTNSIQYRKINHLT